MKKYFMLMSICLTCALLILTGCSSTAGVETEPSETVAETMPETVTATEPPETTAAPTVVEYSYGDAYMQLSIPDGWEYSITEYTEGSDLFGISFWPEGQEARIRLNYYTNLFGVCGTGLSEEETTLENGYRVFIGTYDNHDAWDFVSFQDLSGSYAAINDGLPKVYADQALEILGTAKLGSEA